MTLSLLSAVASSSRQPALNLLASEMIGKKVIDRDCALAIYRESTIPKNRKWVWITAIAAIIIGIAVMVSIPFGNTDSEKTTLIPPDSGNVNKGGSEMISEETGESGTPNEGVVTQHNVPVHKAAEEGAKETVKDTEYPYYVLPEEKVSDEYGVTMEEAKYMALFKRDPVDNYTVERTDAALLDCTNRYYSDDATPEEKRQAYDRYNSVTAIPTDVAAEVMKKYPNADLRRVRGISHQRVLFWHKSYDPLPSLP